MFFGSILSQSTTFRVQLQALRAEKKVPGDLLGRCPLPSCRPGNCRSTKGWIGWDHDMTKRVGKITRITRKHVWTSDSTKVTKGNLYTSGEMALLHIIFLAVKSVSEEVQFQTNLFRKPARFTTAFHVLLLVRGTALNNFIYLLHLSGSSGSSVLTFRDAKRPGLVQCMLHGRWIVCAISLWTSKRAFRTSEKKKKKHDRNGSETSEW